MSASGRIFSWLTKSTVHVILDNFRVWSRISAKWINMWTIGNKLCRPRHLSCVGQKNWWTLVH